MTYLPDPRILALANWIADPVDAAAFPQTVLRFRNDRAAQEVGLAGLTDAEWVDHFGRFTPFPHNLPQPLALRYHGHQFRVYNPDLGDGRGFLFAQQRDDAGRLLDFGTKGSGQTPWSRQGDGRLTLKGAVREILATEMLEALGVNTSRSLSVIETGEQLWRGDEPSPTRSAVLVRMSHGHIRIGTFQRLAALGEANHMAQLVDYCLDTYPGPDPATDGDPANRAAHLLNLVVERMADLAASYMVAGFVHGVLNTDNMNISGESFDYGPWRWLPAWEPGFTAAYFDHAGLYCFGRQPEAIHWNCGQLAVALRLLADAPPLIAALERFPDLYQQALARRWCWRLGVTPHGDGRDTALVSACERYLLASKTAVDSFFFAHRGGRGVTDPALSEALAGYEAVGSTHPYWHDSAPETMQIEDVETLWTAIDAHDNWQPLQDKVEALRRMGQGHGIPPMPAGHAAPERD